MNMPLAFTFLIVGIALLVFGVGPADAIPDAFSRLFSGHLNDRRVWMVVGGVILAIAGLVGCYRSRRV